MVDGQGAVHYFILHTDRSLDQFIKTYSDSCEAKSLMQTIVERERIPFFGCGKEAWQVALQEWNNYFYVPQVFEGRERYYWAISPVV